MFELLKQAAPLPLPDALYAELAAAYERPPRAYHTLGHVAEVAEWFAEVSRTGGWTHPDEVWLAVLFHDAIYEAGRGDNEPRSAALARDAITRHAVNVDTDRVARLIELTAQHGKLADVDPEAQLLLDCDMAILGSDAARFARYEAGIAEEYAALPREVYRAGRSAFLARLCASPRIFLSEPFHDGTRRDRCRARGSSCRRRTRSVAARASKRARTPILFFRAIGLVPYVVGDHVARKGTQQNPAIVRVQTAERAQQVIALCVECGIDYIVGVEPDKPEDISDIDRALNPPEPVRAALKPGRNDPCPCGSGLKTKKCCPELAA